VGKLKLAAIGIGALVSLAAVSPAQQVLAQSPAEQAQSGVNQIGGNQSGTNSSLTGMIRTAVNILLFLTSAIAVVMIIYGGIKYVTSRGEAADVASAKNTILYAVVGLVVAILAYAIVGFVVNAFQSSGSGRSSGTNQQAPSGVGPTP
jgi:multisubunit Na+/H+ antiporter MnhB subunit